MTLQQTRNDKVPVTDCLRIKVVKSGLHELLPHLRERIGGAQ
jgi:hypothetical protein